MDTVRRRYPESRLLHLKSAASFTQHQQQQQQHLHSSLPDIAVVA